MPHNAYPADRGDKGSFTLTGRHVFFIFVAFFGVVIATNVVFVRLALSSFPGEEVKKSYYQGLHYNEILDERAEQLARGWSVALIEAPVAGTQSALRIKLLNREGTPISNARVVASVVRPATGVGAQALDFTYEGDGVYVSDPAALTRGAWNLSVEAWERDAETPALAATSRFLVQ
ncbi:MAG: FixH family protein [Pseudomonadota bacterium]